MSLDGDYSYFSFDFSRMLLSLPVSLPLNSKQEVNRKEERKTNM